MSDANGSPKPPRFRVSMSDDVAAMGREARREADDASLGPAFRVRMYELFEQLQTDPLTAGEPRYDLSHAKIQVRKVVKPPVMLYYGVHPGARQVFIHSIYFLRPA